VIDATVSTPVVDQTLLDMRQVSYRYPGTPAATVQQVDWALPQGAFHCLLGRSGCGKSTLLKLAAGLLLPDRGVVMKHGVTVLKPDSSTGFVFQTPTLLEWANVIDNVLLPISLQRRPNAADCSYAEDLLREVGLLSLQHRHPGQLSGGQQSRVAIARALVTRPKLLFMDEPFAALDALTREELQDILHTLCREHGISALFVTHDIAEAAYLADHVAVMDNGRIVSGIPITLEHPRQPALRQSMAFNETCADLRLSLENKP
jgi:NitT/TauT family transport system ATP-binding protein